MEERRTPQQVESALRELGLQRVRRRSGGFTALCPFHQDKNPSFSISDQGLWMCWSCKEKGNFFQLHERLGADMTDWRSRLRMAGFSLRARADEHRPRKFVNLPEDFSPYSLAPEVPPAIAKRLKWETIEKFSLGSSRQRECLDRCVIPIFYKERCIGWHGRALRPEMVRYYNPKDFAIKDYVFNYDGCKKGGEVIVVEGAFNAMSMVEKGFPNTLAVFGTEFKPDQVKKIFDLAPSTVVICFDRDPSKLDENGREKGRAGQRATLKLGKIICDLLRVEVMPLPMGRDPNDLPADVLAKCYSKKVSFDKVCGV